MSKKALKNTSKKNQTRGSCLGNIVPPAYAATQQHYDKDQQDKHAGERIAATSVAWGWYIAIPSEINLIDSIKLSCWVIGKTATAIETWYPVSQAIPNHTLNLEGPRLPRTVICINLDELG